MTNIRKLEKNNVPQNKNKKLNGQRKIEQGEPHYSWKCEVSVQDGCALFTLCHVTHAKSQVTSYMRWQTNLMIKKRRIVHVCNPFFQINSVICNVFVCFDLFNFCLKELKQNNK